MYSAYTICSKPAYSECVIKINAKVLALWSHTGLSCTNQNVLIFFKLFYIHGSVQRESNLITAQQYATYSVYYISVGSCTRFGC